MTDGAASPNEIGERILGCALKVHRALGPGLLESAYEACLCYELAQAGLRFQRQVLMPVRYSGQSIDVGYRLDIVVEGCVVLELKAVEKVTDLHRAQLLSYLRLGDFWLGYILNFNVKMMRDGIHRLANGPQPS